MKHKIRLKLSDKLRIRHISRLVAILLSLLLIESPTHEWYLKYYRSTLATLTEAGETVTIQEAGRVDENGNFIGSVTKSIIGKDVVITGNHEVVFAAPLTGSLHLKSLTVTDGAIVTHEALGSSGDYKRRIDLRIDGDVVITNATISVTGKGYGTASTDSSGTSIGLYGGDDCHSELTDGGSMYLCGSGGGGSYAKGGNGWRTIYATDETWTPIIPEVDRWKQPIKGGGGLLADSSSDASAARYSLNTTDYQDGELRNHLKYYYGSEAGAVGCNRGAFGGGLVMLDIGGTLMVASGGIMAEGEKGSGYTHECGCIAGGGGGGSVFVKANMIYNDRSVGSKVSVAGGNSNAEKGSDGMGVAYQQGVSAALPTVKISANGGASDTFPESEDSDAGPQGGLWAGGGGGGVVQVFYTQPGDGYCLISTNATTPTDVEVNQDCEHRHVIIAGKNVRAFLFLTPTTFMPAYRGRKFASLTVRDGATLTSMSMSEDCTGDPEETHCRIDVYLEGEINPATGKRTGGDLVVANDGKIDVSLKGVAAVPTCAPPEGTDPSYIHHFKYRTGGIIDIKAPYGTIRLDRTGLIRADSGMDPEAIAITESMNCSIEGLQNYAKVVIQARDYELPPLDDEMTKAWAGGGGTAQSGTVVTKDINLIAIDVKKSTDVDKLNTKAYRTASDFPTTYNISAAVRGTMYLTINHVHPTDVSYVPSGTIILQEIPKARVSMSKKQEIVERTGVVDAAVLSTLNPYDLRVDDKVKITLMIHNYNPEAPYEVTEVYPAGSGLVCNPITNTMGGVAVTTTPSTIVDQVRYDPDAKQIVWLVSPIAELLSTGSVVETRISYECKVSG